MKNKTALITGSSRGIGKAICDSFSEEGINIITPTRKEMDLLSNESIDAYLGSLKKQVDILVNNAGINQLDYVIKASDQNITDTIQINLVAPFRLIRSLAPGMVQKRFGRIVNISSIWGMVTKPQRSTYSMTKAGLISMTRTAAVELAEYDVLVNSIAPGYVNTELTKKNNTPEEIDRIVKTIPIKRLAEPGEIAKIALFLASDKNTYITGQTLVADGGFTCL